MATPVNVVYLDPADVTKAEYLLHHVEDTPVFPPMWGAVFRASEYFSDLIESIELRGTSSVRALARLHEIFGAEEKCFFSFNELFSPHSTKKGPDFRQAFSFMLQLSPSESKRWVEFCNNGLKANPITASCRVVEANGWYEFIVPTLGSLAVVNRHQRMEYLRFLREAFQELRYLTVSSYNFVEGERHRTVDNALMDPFEHVDSEHVDVLVVGREIWMDIQTTYPITGGRSSRLEDILTKVQAMRESDNYVIESVTVINTELAIENKKATEAKLNARTVAVWSGGSVKNGVVTLPEIVAVLKGPYVLDAIRNKIADDKNYGIDTGWRISESRDGRSIVTKFFYHDQEVYPDYSTATRALFDSIRMLPGNKEYSLWVEGYAVTGQKEGARFEGTIHGPTFNAAVHAYVSNLKPEDASYWNFDPNSQAWTCWACRAFDNEADARKNFG